MFLSTKQAFFLIAMLSIFNLYGQEPALEGCGYTGKSEWLKNYQANRHLAASDRDVDTSWLYVPVTIHIVGNDAGGGYFGSDQALRAICEMNDQYAPSHIRFYMQPGDPFRYHNNSSWFNHGWQGGSEMINENRIPGRLNAFVVADPAGNCGYAWQDAIVLGKACSNANNTTWAHEAGHHLSLPHPFYGWEGFSWNYTDPAPEQTDNGLVEKIDGTNCNFAGDGFCDTRADYLNYRWSCNNDLESTTLQKDPNGVQFRSDATIIMGYALDACASRFSEEQTEAMRANLYTEHNDYLQISSPLSGISDDVAPVLNSPLDTVNVQYNDFTLSFNAVPGATMYQVEVGMSYYFLPILYKTFLINPSVATNGMIQVHVTKAMPINRLLYWRVRPYNEWDVCQFNANETIGVFKTQNLTATNELERSMIAELMPNPVVSGMPAIVQISSEMSMDAQLRVNDFAGRLCYQQNFRLTAGEQQIEIPTEQLSAGAYLITIQNEKGMMMKRMVVTQE